MDGNYDLPVCAGSLINPHNLPPWQLSVHSALAGLRSRELGESGRSNHVLFDDTSNQM